MVTTQRKSGNKASKPVRTDRGQALVEGTVMLGVMIVFVVLLLLVLINTYQLSNYNYRLQAIATEAARKVSADKWWLGMERPEYNYTQSCREAEEIAKEELVKNGLVSQSADISPFTWSTSFAQLRGKRVTIVKVAFNLNKAKIISGGFFPSAVKLQASGIASDAEHAVTKHGVALIHADDGAGNQTAIRVPVYNATIGNNTPAHSGWMNAGDAAVGDAPHAYLRMECSSAGSTLQRMSTDRPNSFKLYNRAPW